MNTFADFNLALPLERALAELRYNTPTQIQQLAIPPAMEGRDILGCAQTGTGKTAAFALPILNDLAVNKRRAVRNRPAGLILAPTRELVVQIGESLRTYGQHVHFRHSLVYGGVSQKPQVNALRRGLHVVAATPGRLLDLMEQGHIRLQDLDFFVLDEVDRMLDMGFLPDIKRIVSELPEKRQSLFFSATMPPDIRELSQQLLHDPVRINVTPKTVTVRKIKQSVLLIEKRRKTEALRHILADENVKRTVVFTSTKRNANRIEKDLQTHGLRAVAIHGNKSQNARQKALVAFQKDQYQVLVATDVASRGIDIEGITHVVNFDLPQEPECYVHRIGRTGRAGESGTAITFCTSGEMRALRSIENVIKRKLTVSRKLDGIRLPEFKEESSESSKGETRKKRSDRRSSNSRSNNSRSNGPRSNNQQADSSKSRNSKRKKRKVFAAKKTKSWSEKPDGSSSTNSNSKKRNRRRSKPAAQTTASTNA